jgi:O-antigen ligase
MSLERAGSGFVTGREAVEEGSAEAAVLRLARIAFAALIVLSPFRAHIELVSRPTGRVRGDYTDFVLFWSDLALLAVLALWGLSLLLRPRPVATGPALIRWPAAGLLALVWLTVVFSVDAPLSAYQALRLTLGVALALYAINKIDDLRQVTPALIVMVIVQAVIGLVQVLGQESVGLNVLAELQVDPSVSSASVVWDTDGTRILRAYGLTENPNIFGGLLAFSLLLLIAICVSTRSWMTALYVSVIALGSVGVVLSFSRSAALAFAAGLLVAFALLAYSRAWLSLRRMLAICLVAGLAAAPFAVHYGDAILNRSNLTSAELPQDPEERSLRERRVLFDASWDVFQADPVTGAGAGALPIAIERRDPDFGYDYQPAHFVPLVVAAENGVFAALCYIALIVAPWVLLWRRRHALTLELVGASAALLAVIVVGLFDYYTWSQPPGRIWTWIALGFWVVAYSRSEPSAITATA